MADRNPGGSLTALPAARREGLPGKRSPAWRVATAAALTLVVALTFFVVRREPEQRRAELTFASAVGVHEGSDVRVMGVKVGEVTRVEPRGTTVLVEVAYRTDIPIP